jgi:16S rRNA G1207 methylase RsmC
VDDPWLEGVLTLKRAGSSLSFLVPSSVFSSHRIDDGTLLLLGHLPPGEPRSFLDLGCGYGALGLAVAARHPRARGLLVDRDLLAVEYARRNACAQGASSVEVLPGLGYRDLPAAAGPFDWILSNLPARAGAGVFEELLRGGLARLAPGGEVRVVVIAPLARTVEDVASRCGFPCRAVAATARHAVFSLPEPAAPPGPRAPLARAELRAADDAAVYRRDSITVALPEPLHLVRPTDLADEPHRLESAIPLVARNLPSSPPANVLSYRSGYGLVPALVLTRYPGARVVAVDRDLLATAFTRLNSAAVKDAGPRLTVRECFDLGSVSDLGPFALILGEILAPAGAAATVAELRAARRLLAPGGRALVLGLAKQWKEFLREVSSELGLTLRAKDGAVALYQIRAASCGETNKH